MDVIALDHPTDAQIRQWHEVLAAVHAADPGAEPAPDPERTARLLLSAEPGRGGGGGRPPAAAGWPRSRCCGCPASPARTVPARST